ncbi:MAG TPA: hypothetical protein VK763_13315 [Terriglobales bacterium]|jgi:hypothetical protein|nr:hypothetical protein [Terriglobales bacterium]
MKHAVVVTSLLVLASLSALAQTALARNKLYVDGVHGNDNNNCESRQTACKTIGHAISLASPGDAILVGPATYYENLTINFSLGIIGSSASTTIIDGQALNTVVNIPNTDTHTVLAGLTIRNGAALYFVQGGGVQNDGSLTIFNLIISGNNGQYGGGLSNEGVATVYDSTISGNVGGENSSGSEGGGVWNDGTLTLNRTTVSQNETAYEYFGSGSGIYNAGTLVVNDSTISNNTTTTSSPTGGGHFQRRDARDERQHDQWKCDFGGRERRRRTLQRLCCKGGA